MVMSEGAGEGWMQERGLDHWRVAVERHGDVAGVVQVKREAWIVLIIKAKGRQ